MKLFALITLVAASMMLGTASARAASGVAKITGTAEGSSVAGTLKLSEEGKGLRVSGDISGLTPGQHGFHIHEFGDCSDSGKAAGSHYNPMNHPHGNALKEGQNKAHAGDMGNIEADAQGVARVDVILPGLGLSGGKMNAAGRAVVVHEKADDFGQPVGNAGGRIGCGPVIVTGN